MYQTEFNKYGMDSSVNDSAVIYKAEQLIRSGRNPRDAYNQAIKEVRESRNGSR